MTAVWVAALATAAAGVADVEQTRYYNQSFDHFNPEGPSGTWRQRYYTNATFVKATSKCTPTFFIPGGEWSVGPSKGILYGLAHDLAAAHDGLMMIVEHRFYGESLPFGETDSFIASPARLGLLTIEQAMADYVKVIRHVQEEHSISGCPVVALGGSYSGKLSAYMRLKYPFVISMALAASAPIYLDSVGLTNQYAYYDVVEKATANVSPECPSAVSAAFKAYDALPAERRKDALELCSPVPRAEFGWDELEFYIVQYFATMAMFNYPPATSPLRSACMHVLAGGGGLGGFQTLLRSLRPANATCFDLNAQAPGSVPKSRDFIGSTGSVACSDWSGCGPSTSWDFQACTQVTQPLGIKPDSTMFPEHSWSESWMKSHCNRRFGVVPKFEHLRDTMGLDDIRRWPQPARIIFSNGLQDPWHAGGQLTNATATMIAITIPNGAHHQDLNGGNSPNDTPDMLAARRQEMRILADWLQEHE